MSQFSPEQGGGDELMTMISIFADDITPAQRQAFLDSLSPEARLSFSQIDKTKQDWVIAIDHVDARDLQRYRNFAEFSRLNALSKHADAGIKQFLEAHSLWLSLMRSEDEETLRQAA